MASHTTKRICVIVGSMTTRTPQKRIAKIGMSGTKGQRNGRTRSGAFLRRMMTDAETMMKAPNVPILTISATTPIGTRPARMDDTTATNKELRTGVLVFWLIWPKKRGSRPSRDMTKRIRLWPRHMTRRTDVRPQIAPTDTAAAPQ